MAVRYVLWPKPPLHAAAVGDDRKTYLAWVASMAVVMGVFSLPTIEQATGIPRRVSLGMLGAMFVWYTFQVFVLAKPTRTSMNIRLAADLLTSMTMCLAFCVASGDARTPLWMLPAIYAAINGAMPEVEPSATHLAVHTIGPLATIPIFHVLGSESRWSIAAPVLCAAISAGGYHMVAMATARWREVRAEQEKTVAALRAKLAERDRSRLAQDLHDSIGSVLGVVALYGDLIERKCDRPDELRAIAGMVREATREGLTDLRSVIGAIAPASTDVAGVARALRPMVGRAAEASGIDVSLSVEGDASASIDGPARLAVVRVFQEALANAMRHADAARVSVILRGEGDDVRLEVADDGRGFDDTKADEHAGGRGLRGMRERIEELGGAFEVESGSGRGTRVRARIPRGAA